MRLVAFRKRLKIHQKEKEKIIYVKLEKSQKQKCKNFIKNCRSPVFYNWWDAVCSVLK